MQSHLSHLIAGFAICGAIFWLTSACASKGPIPDLPVVDMTVFQPGVRQVVSAAVEAAKSNSLSAEAVGRLGMVLHAHDRFSAAITCYQRATRLDSKRFDYWYYWGAALSSDGKYAEAIEPLRNARLLRPQATPIGLKLADALLETGRVEDAKRTYQEVIATDDRIASAHYGLARTLKGAEAVKELNKALELFPEYGAAQFALAAEYRKSGNTEEAERALKGYEQHRKSTPPLDDPLLASVFALNAGPTGLLRQAQALEREGRLAESAAVCERAVERFPTFEQAWVNLISLYGRLGQSEKLEQAYQKAIALAPNRAEAYYNYGVFCFKAGRSNDARTAFKKASDLDPNNADAWNNLGTVTEQTGRLETAAGYFRRAIAARPEMRAAHFHLARIYANQRRYADAIPEFEKTLNPKDDQTPTYLYALAATHARAGHRQQSLEYLKQARLEASNLGQAALVASIDKDLRSLEAAR